jgi:hypothetical protein
MNEERNYERPIQRTNTSRMYEENYTKEAMIRTQKIQRKKQRKRNFTLLQRRLLQDRRLSRSMFYAKNSLR